LLDVQGALYGTTAAGGSGCTRGCGTVYRISTTGDEKVLHNFGGGSDGATPVAGFINVNGTLYGTTEYGGGSGCYGYGCGTVYSINTSGTERVLYRFDGRSDGSGPQVGLVSVNGTLYGTTENGGGSGCYGYGCGTVYSISTAGKEKVLHRFSGGSDGTQPLAGLIDANGELFGTTFAGGGSGCDGSGCGTVYRISTTGKEKVLHSFGNGSDGANPMAALTNRKGTLYGATEVGGSGCYSGCGTVFALAP
jgi:uncharacterized repeat protein (TIGR03803 family)